ncbi:hypothetical protein Pmar_PMAR006824 [Perkinsus marinus ATCC 50983]|uniref:Uncharacterized protein n=1 Tax=Perkinsus marinus (strain ATCC 50983 / TXsc) TaxID=423536 RepID=C5K6L0_PERM5|nr:hypothetical protein Pmar_PMAR006824 [Perkinsus marinus ATCC 50983]EER19930.1 hypothetical protein Pmar_PMAR006824 [Perkinsus marinus ATCC 50983]|eukprot:XP_002788134.1 hypothetical protein Pmar_PMAR006824 [Perkinsus marinus ATCC 50983]
MVDFSATPVGKEDTKLFWGDSVFTEEAEEGREEEKADGGTFGSLLDNAEK